MPKQSMRRSPVRVRGSVMPILPRKSILAIAAVTDIALNSRSRPVAAKDLASRHRLPPRHLEPVLQALVREGILKGARGPHGGYELAREQRRITAEEILRAARTVDDGAEEPVTVLHIEVHVNVGMQDQSLYVGNSFALGPRCRVGLLWPVRARVGR